MLVFIPAQLGAGKERAGFLRAEEEAFEKMASGSSEAHSALVLRPGQAVSFCLSFLIWSDASDLSPLCVSVAEMSSETAAAAIQ